MKAKIFEVSLLLAPEKKIQFIVSRKDGHELNSVDKLNAHDIALKHLEAQGCSTVEELDFSKINDPKLEFALYCREDDPNYAKKLVITEVK